MGTKFFVPGDFESLMGYDPGRRLHLAADIANKKLDGCPRVYGDSATAENTNWNTDLGPYDSVVAFLVDIQPLEKKCEHHNVRDIIKEQYSSNGSIILTFKCHCGVELEPTGWREK